MKRPSKREVLVGVGLFQVGQAFLMVNLAWLQHHFPALYARTWPAMAQGAAIEVLLTEAAFSGLALTWAVKRFRKEAVPS